MTRTQEKTFINRLALAAIIGILCVTGGSAVADRCDPTISLVPLSTYQAGSFDEGAAEITAYDPLTKRLFVTNSETASVDVLDYSDPSNPNFIFSIDLTPWGDGPTHVAVHHSLLAVSVVADPETDNGQAVFFRTWDPCNFLKAVEVGALPDMFVFSPNGR